MPHDAPTTSMGDGAMASSGNGTTLAGDDPSAPPGHDVTALAPPAWEPDHPDFEARVIRAFIRAGRLVSIPARERKKLVIYRYLLEEVLPDPNETVHERDLNMRLALWHPDVATIRRALVDLKLARRDRTGYQRSVPRR
ncbi:MAG: DUF2087 domain-containing protein [Chloroflexi bacterium]|nr:DUF2087 domain-containing protein [Chloroflexota bacterium]